MALTGGTCILGSARMQFRCVERFPDQVGDDVRPAAPDSAAGRQENKENKQNKTYMKRLIYCAAALVTVLFAGSCNKELETALGGDSHVTFTVSTGEVATKADIADGTNVNALHWEIYLKSNRDIAEKSLGKGVVVLDEVYKRNELIETLYNCKIEIVEVTDNSS